MQQAFLTGEDIHRSTAAKIYGLPLEQVTPRLRSSAKAINFGIMYGKGAYSLSKDIGVSVKGSGRLPEKLSGHLPESQRLHGQDHLRRPELRLCVHPLRTPPLPAGAGQQQSQHPGQRRADGPQHADPRHRRRRHQAGDGAGLAASAGREDGEPPHPRPSTTSSSSRPRRQKPRKPPPSCRKRWKAVSIMLSPEHRSASGQNWLEAH